MTMAPKFEMGRIGYFCQNTGSFKLYQSSRRAYRVKKISQNIFKDGNVLGHLNDAYVGGGKMHSKSKFYS